MPVHRVIAKCCMITLRPGLGANLHVLLLGDVAHRDRDAI